MLGGHRNAENLDRDARRGVGQLLGEDDRQDLHARAHWISEVARLKISDTRARGHGFA